VTGDSKLAAKLWRLAMEGCNVLPLQLRFVPCGLRRSDRSVPWLLRRWHWLAVDVKEVLGSHAPLAASLAPAKPPC
jgi:hypothetical protein